MQDFALFNKTRHALTMNPAALNHLQKLPGWCRDRFIGIDSYSDHKKNWEIAEVLLSEAVTDRKASDSFFLSCLVKSYSDRAHPLEVDFNAGRFLRSNKPGSMVFGGSGVTEKLQGVGPYHSLAFYVRKDFLTSRLRELLGKDAPSFDLLHSNSFHDPGLEILLKKLMQECRSDSPCSTMMRENLIDSIAARLMTVAKIRIKSSQPVSDLSQPQINRVIDYLHANFQSDISLEQLGQVAGVSRCYISRVFTRVVGESPKRYLLKLRIDHAKLLLAQKQPLSEIARSCGFAHQSHLGAEFKRQVGVTPDEYRRHC